jgi:AcrR family transcriptional regulator
MANSPSAKEKIIQSARHLFTEAGFAGTSTQRIAEHAGVSHALIFHHFGNKHALWQAVKQSIARDDAGRSKTLPSTELPLNVFLGELIRSHVRFYQIHPEITKLLAWQRLEPQSLERSVGLSPEAEAWLTAIRHYQGKGELDASLDPKHVMGLILSVTSAAALDLQAWMHEKSDFDAYLDFCIHALIKALTVSIG